MKTTKMTKAIILLTLCIEEVEKGSHRWQYRGGQSHGWAVWNYIVQRYSVPQYLAGDILHGFLRAQT